MAKPRGNSRPSKSFPQAVPTNRLGAILSATLQSCTTCAKTGNSAKNCPHRKKK